MEGAQGANGQGSLDGRVALVTGGGTGLGKAIALTLAARGVAVAVNYSRSQAEAHAVVAEIEEAGGRAVAVQADVADQPAVTAMVSHVAATLGPVEVLVNNAGTTQYVPFGNLDELTVELWERVLGVNLIGASLCIQAVAPTMRERGFGRIMSVSSNSVYVAEGSCIPYVASKAALISLTQCLARALAPSVCINAVAPGWMLTPWLDKHLPDTVAQRLRSGAEPIAETDDVARLTVDVLGNGSITGQALVIDSGEMWQIPGIYPIDKKLD